MISVAKVVHASLKHCYMTAVLRYPSLRVAYVEEREEIVSDVPKKVYYSILVKAVNGFDQVAKAFLQYLIIWCAI